MILYKSYHGIPSMYSECTTMQYNGFPLFPIQFIFIPPHRTSCHFNFIFYGISWLLLGKFTFQRYYGWAQNLISLEIECVSDDSAKWTNCYSFFLLHDLILNGVVSFDIFVVDSIYHRPSIHPFLMRESMCILPYAGMHWSVSSRFPSHNP